MVVVGVLIYFLFWALEFPNSPARGGVMATIDVGLGLVSLLVLIGLALYVWDVTSLAARFVDAVSVGDTRWPATTVNARLVGVLGIEGEIQPPKGGDRELSLPQPIADFLDVEAIAERSDVVGRLILYPFVVLMVLLASRSRAFDDLSWPWSIVAVVGLVLGIALSSAVTLRREALRARERAIRRMELARVRELSAGAGAEKSGSGNRVNAAQIAALIERLRRIETGAFAPWTANPVVGAVLIPFGGAALAGFLDTVVRLWS